jgi:hypothetical protein
MPVLMVLKRVWGPFLAFGLGCYVAHRLQHPAQLPVTKAEIATASKVATATKAIKQVSVQTVKEPDGTQVQTQTTTTEADATNETDQSSTESVAAPARSDDPYSPARYSVDLTTRPTDYKDVKVGVGARLGGLPVFGVVEYEIQSRTVRAGLRGEW